MNISEAKTEIANTLRVYMQKDSNGKYIFPPARQRPILLMGPPGIGKTAIMEQIAKEESTALVMYTMTHHTRQSAIGLPRLAERVYGDETYVVTEYTISEIIASVYEAMERTGLKEGILFLDEINCVSETLAPVMLQFLQNKIFGNQKLPEGWIIVAAGNPPEYNKSVREFDVVTLDRVRILNVEADADVFLDYAAQKELHGAICSYLTLKPERFYFAERTEESLSYVTARGWEDLSAVLTSYEQLGVTVTAELIAEFLCSEDTVRDFFAYYRLYMKYGTDYAVPELLSGSADEETRANKQAMACSGDFTERFTLVNLISSYMNRLFLNCRRSDRLCTAVHEAIRQFFSSGNGLEEYIAERRRAEQTKKRFGLLSFEEERFAADVNAELDEILLTASGRHIYDDEGVKQCCREGLDGLVEKRAAGIAETAKSLANGFNFLTDCFGDRQELTLFLTNLTTSPAAMEFITMHGSTEYLEYSERFLFRSGEENLRKACRAAMNGAKS